MKNQIAKGYVEEVGDDGVLQAAIASTGTADRMGDVIEPEGWNLTNFKANPALLWGHNADSSRMPIGKVLKIWLENGKLMFTPQFDLKDSFAAEVFRKFKDGFLNAFSVGFRPLEWEDAEKGIRFLKSELLEISAVPVPANPEALLTLKEAGIETTTWKALIGSGMKPDKVEEAPTEGPEEIVSDDGDESDINRLEEENKRLKSKLDAYKATEKQMDVTRDALRIVDQAVSILLKNIKQLRR